jgi:hypothetical protein
MSGIRNALFEVSKNSYGLRMKSDSESLVNYELQNLEFLLAVVMWYDIVFAVITVSKTPLSREMQLDVAFTQIEGLTFCRNKEKRGFHQPRSQQQKSHRQWT